MSAPVHSVLVVFFFWEQQISDCFDIYEYNLPKNPVSRGILKVNIADVKQKYLKNVTDTQGIST